MCVRTQRHYPFITVTDGSPSSVALSFVIEAEEKHVYSISLASSLIQQEQQKKNHQEE